MCQVIYLYIYYTGFNKLNWSKNKIVIIIYILSNMRNKVAKPTRNVFIYLTGFNKLHNYGSQFLPER